MGVARPIPKSPEVSERMRNVRTSGTKPEQLLVAEFKRRRYLVESNVDNLPGKPDLILPRQNVAIFVHGCFWHGCPKHIRYPKHNRKWWIDKIAKNRIRDSRKSQQLRRLGWSVFNVWEHDDPFKAAERIRNSILRKSSQTIENPK